MNFYPAPFTRYQVRQYPAGKGRSGLACLNLESADYAHRVASDIVNGHRSVESIFWTKPDYDMRRVTWGFEPVYDPETNEYGEVAP